MAEEGSGVGGLGGVLEVDGRLSMIKLLVREGGRGEGKEICGKFGLWWGLVYGILIFGGRVGVGVGFLILILFCG